MLAVHLGHKLYADSRSDDLDSIIGTFYRPYNAFRCRLGQISSVAQAGLFSITVAHFIDVRYCRTPQNGEVECCTVENSGICLASV